MEHADFMKTIRKHNNAIENPTSKAALLRKKIMHENHSNDEWLSLQEELREFIASNPSEDELKELQGCGESLAMICKAINEKKIIEKHPTS